MAFDEKKHDGDDVPATATTGTTAAAVERSSTGASSSHNASSSPTNKEAKLTSSSSASGAEEESRPTGLVGGLVAKARLRTGATKKVSHSVDIENGEAGAADADDSESSRGAAPGRRLTGGSGNGAPEGRDLRRSFTSLLQPDKPLGPAPSTGKSILNVFKYTPLNVLLLLIPVSWALHFAKPDMDLAIFIISFLAIMPLAAIISYCTEEVALRVGQTLGGLLNATLGNIVELIVAIVALFHCELIVTQTSLIGSILSNILLVLGTCFIVGGIRYAEQEFKVTAAQLNQSLLCIAVIAALVPAAFHATLSAIPDPRERADILKISRGTAIILLILYVGYLFFQLSSHKHLYEDEGDEEEEPTLSVPVAIGALLVATALVGVTSEWLVESLDGFSSKYGVPKTWIGIILLPIASNAAEHVSAVIAAHKDKMDLAMGVAVGSAIQISLGVIPVLVIIGWIADKPLSMLYDPLVSILLFLSVLLVSYTLADGRSNWAEGMGLVFVFALIGLVTWFVDDAGQSALFPDEFCRDPMGFMMAAPEAAAR